jgi:hypothetical protein
LELNLLFLNFVRAYAFGLFRIFCFLGRLFRNFVREKVGVAPGLLTDGKHLLVLRFLKLFLESVELVHEIRASLIAVFQGRIRKITGARSRWISGTFLIFPKTRTVVLRFKHLQTCFFLRVSCLLFYHLFLFLNFPIAG